MLPSDQELPSSQIFHTYNVSVVLCGGLWLFSFSSTHGGGGGGFGGVVRRSSRGAGGWNKQGHLSP